MGFVTTLTAKALITTTTTKAIITAIAMKFSELTIEMDLIQKIRRRSLSMKVRCLFTIKLYQ